MKYWKEVKKCFCDFSFFKAHKLKLVSRWWQIFLSQE